MATPNGCPDPPAADAADGPYIPAELIPDIAKHLTNLNDIFALRGGCRAYRAALPLSRDLLAAQPPCLLVPHSATSPSLPLFNLLEPGCPSFSLALFHVPDRRLHRFRARLPFARTGGVLTSDGAQVVAVDAAAAGEIIVTHLLYGAQARLPKPPLPHDRVILTGGHLFAPATGRTDVQCCSPWTSPQWTVASYGGEHEIQDWHIVNGVLYGFLPTCGLVSASPSKDSSSSLDIWHHGGEFDPQVLLAMQESKGAPLLGDCGGEVLLIFKVGSIDPAYKIFRWDADELMWAAATSLGGRTLFIGFDDFAACIGPDVPGIRGDCVYASLPWAGGWSEYSMIDGTCKCFTAKYPGEPGVGFARPQVWVLPSLFCN
ncbi:uncharacterized protein LOC124673351 [Lolium rigidum]|uniref:uncharacterized protein LOC124673351 n=1 Tax=Lolium rigidum TaxID=89674 RepID=UPI001F5CF16D|nr:uncharacterized protein LOC124673351 [Lolium rigidum]